MIDVADRCSGESSKQQSSWGFPGRSSKRFPRTDDLPLEQEGHPGDALEFLQKSAQTTQPKLLTKKL